MAEQIKYGDRLFLAGEKVILDNGETSPKLEARNGELVIGYNKLDTQAKDHHVLIRGDLTVEGTMTSIQTVDTVIKDNIIVLNDGEPGDGVSTIRSGIEVDRGTFDNETFLFSEEGWLGTGGVDPAIDVVLPSWLSSTLSLTNDLSAENIYARNSATVNGNLDVTGQLTASSEQEHQIGDFTFNQNVMSVVSSQMEIRSPGGISFYPDEDNSLPVPQGGEKIVWLRDGAKLVFEGTIPDDYEVKLQATDITADRDIILPDESGTLALQEWTTREIDKIKNRIGDTPPENPLNGNLWWNSNTGRLKIYYEDIDGSQWVDAFPATGTVTQQLQTNENGDIVVDLSNYYNIAQIDSIISNIELTPGPQGEQGPPGDNANIDLTLYALKTDIDTAISDLVNGANSSFDTLKEIQDAMATDVELSNAINNLSIPTDVNQLTDVSGLLSGGTGGENINLEYDSEARSVTSGLVDTGGAFTVVENFTDISTPVDNITLSSDMSMYTLVKITVDNGVDDSYILSSTAYTHDSGVITFNPATEDGKVPSTQSIEVTNTSIYYQQVVVLPENAINVRITKLLFGYMVLDFPQVNNNSTMWIINDDGNVEFQFSGGPHNLTVHYDILVDQDQLVSFEVELESNTGYVNLGTTDKPYKSLYVDNISVTNGISYNSLVGIPPKESRYLPVLEVHVHDLSDDDASPTIMDLETYSGVYITGTNTISIHPLNYIKIPDGTVSGQRFFWFNDGSQVVLTINGSTNSGHVEGEYVWTGSVWKKL